MSSECIQAIKDATRQDYTPQQADEVLKAAKKLRDQVYQDNDIDNKEKAINDALNQNLEDVKLAKKVAAKQKLQMFRLHQTAFNTITQKFKAEDIPNHDDRKKQLKAYKRFAKKVAESINGLLQSNRFLGRNAARSVQVEKLGLLDQYHTYLETELEKAGLFQEAAKGIYDEEISRYTKDNDQTVTSNAKKIADIYSNTYELLRLEANKHGANIGKDDEYLGRRSYNMDTIKDAGENAFLDYLKNRLDVQTTIANAKKEGEALGLEWKGDEAYFRSLYKALSSGVHLGPNNPFMGQAFKGTKNIAKGMSHQKILVFKDGHSIYEFQQKFGTGNFLQSLVRAIEYYATNTSLMKILSANPRQFLDSLTDNIISHYDHGDPDLAEEVRRNLTDNKANIERIMSVASGEVDIPANRMLARWSRRLRTFINMAKLGGIVLSALPDGIRVGSELRFQDGGTLLTGLGRSVGAFIKGRPDLERQQILGTLGVLSNSNLISSLERFNIDRLDGTGSKEQSLFFKLTGQNRWNDSIRADLALGFSNRLYHLRNTEHGKLPKGLRDVLNAYGIGKNEWSVIRKGVQKHSDGTGFITPEGIKDKNMITDDDLAQLAEKRQLPISNFNINRIRDELADNLRGYVSDRTRIGLGEGGIRTKATLTRGLQVGTPEGELARAVTQFKTDPVAFWQTIIQREIQGREGQTGIQSPLYNIASMIVSMTMLGYVSMSLKDLTQGLTPRDGTDPKTWFAAAAQGGGLGIFGDFLFGDLKNRFGGSAIDTIVGPAAGEISGMLDLMQRAATNDDFGSASSRFIFGNMPFLNLFYTRAALNYLVLYDIQDRFNPGSLIRMEKQRKKQNDQEFIYPPSIYAARPFD